MQPEILSIKETGLLGGNDKQNIAQDRGERCHAPGFESNPKQSTGSAQFL